ncbi:hypothetical protein [Vallitalea guaymasensis]|nr:hypothetical protein [Vallitalea guaymasensis]
MRSSGQENGEKIERTIKNNGKYDNDINIKKEKYDKESKDNNIR